LTPKLNHRADIDELDAYLEIIGNVIADGKRNSGIGALCMMALVVRRFPPGDLRDAAEDILCSYIGTVRPSSEELDKIRQVRRGDGGAVCGSAIP
jgi:hypothetical protein